MGGDHVSLLAVIFGKTSCAAIFECVPKIDRYGGIFIWLGIMAYMFKALGTVCDEYFVPALEAIVEKFQLSNDVLGATFMAAGSSAPEFFTSVVATFLIVNEAGVGTIIGSAVFNLLVIIGAIGLEACKEQPLKIWWYPMARDTFFSLVSVVELLCFLLDDKVEWWESLIMVFTFILYCIYMKFNPRIVLCFGLVPPEREVADFESGDVVIVGAAEDGQAEPDPEEGAIVLRPPSADGAPKPLTDGVARPPTAGSARPPTAGSARPPTAGSTRPPTAGSTRPPSADGSLSGNFRDLRAASVGTGEAPTAGVTDNPPPLPPPASTEEPSGPRSSTRMSRLSRSLSQRFSMRSSLRSSLRTSSKKSVDPGYEGRQRRPRWSMSELEFIDRNALEASKPVGNAAWPFSPSTRGVQRPEPEEAPRASSKASSEVEEEPEELPPEVVTDPRLLGKELDTLSLGSPDKTLCGCRCFDPILKFWEITMPTPKWKWLLFSLSFVYIAICTYIVVDATNRVGVILRIPALVMGLIVLGAGTSIPDALGSIAVAKQGEIDMAVANALGSTVFNILFGLGFPWLVRAITGQKVEFLGAFNDVLFDIVILILILVFFPIALAINRWFLTRTTGIVLLCFYGLYVFINFCLLLAGAKGDPDKN